MVKIINVLIERAPLFDFLYFCFLDLTNNIAKIFGKFLDEGKCTISLKMPEIDVQVKADAIQLKAFLNVIKNELSPADAKKKSVPKSDNTLLRAFGSSSKPIDVVTKMKITQRSAFPSKGLPRTLKELNINDIGLSQMPIGVLNLTNLTTLDLTNNCITKLHKSLGNLKISNLVLTKNDLGDSVLTKDWDWLNGENIRRSLLSLSISKNNLKYIPSNIFKCSELVQLDFSCNKISRIPFAIKQMKKLKLLSLSDNNLESLPYTIIKPHFDLIDLSSNRFPSETNVRRITHENHKTLHSQENSFRSPSLLELSARAIIKRQIPFLNHLIPSILKEILVHSPLCANGKCEVLCFDMETFRNISIIQLNTKQRVTSDNASCFPADGPFCSRACAQIVFKKLFNQ